MADADMYVTACYGIFLIS